MCGLNSFDSGYNLSTDQAADFDPVLLMIITTPMVCSLHFQPERKSHRSDKLFSGRTSTQ